MRILCTILLACGVAIAQEASTPAANSKSQPIPASTSGQTPVDRNSVTIPAGTKIPLSLKQAISTKNAREGDAVYAETAFPFVVDTRVIVPAGSYIQ
ncbi:MAG: hypothetical protein WAN65_10730 [Candidatus Sulfotelmatobacter sp.]